MYDVRKLQIQMIMSRVLNVWGALSIVSNGIHTQPPSLLSGHKSCSLTSSTPLWTFARQAITSIFRRRVRSKGSVSYCHRIRSNKRHGAHLWICDGNWGIVGEWRLAAVIGQHYGFHIENDASLKTRNRKCAALIPWCSMQGCCAETNLQTWSQCRSAKSLGSVFGKFLDSMQMAMWQKARGISQNRESCEERASGLARESS